MGRFCTQECNAPINIKPQDVGEGRPTHGKLTSKAGTWVGILTYSRCPREGNLAKPPTSDAKKDPRGRNLTQKCCSGEGKLTSGSEKMSNSPGVAPPSPHPGA